MSPRVFKVRRKHPFLPAFSLIELLAVMAILFILSGIAVFGISNSSLHARQNAREIAKSHLQQARAHAIATRALTAMIIPIGANDQTGLCAVSLIEVEAIDDGFIPVINNNGDATLLQRWTMLPQNFHFVSNSLIQSKQLTVVDHEKTLIISQQGHEMKCQMIVFASNGQIIYPLSGVPIYIAIAQVVRNGHAYRIDQTSNHGPIFDLLLVNRLTAKTRNIVP